MAIQTRRGNYADFVPENLLEGEVASVLDKKYVYVGMPNGDAVQLGTMEKIEEVLEEAEGYRDSAKTYSESASASSTAASASKSAAKTSEDNAKTSETNAAASASTATTKASEASSSAQSASTSQSAAKTSEDNAKESETKAEASKDNAKSSEDNAKTSETNAKASEDAAVSAKNDAVTAKNTAVTKASEASASATESKSWAVGGTSSREAEDSNNSKYWSDKAKDYSDEAKAVATNQWSAIQNKPFSSIGANLSVDADGALNAEAGGAGSWNDLTGKPFSAIGDNLSVDSDGNLNADASGAWGSITGTLSDQTDLKNALDGKASASDVNSISSTIANAEDNGYLPKDGVSSMSNVELTEEVDTLSNEKANNGSSAYSSSKAYVVGDDCTYNGKLYSCISDCQNVAPPNTTYWSEVTLSTVNNNLGILIPNYANAQTKYNNITVTDQTTITINESGLYFIHLNNTGSTDVSNAKCFIDGCKVLTDYLGVPYNANSIQVYIKKNSLISFSDTCSRLMFSLIKV